MKRTMLKSKIHRATVTDANLKYEGSITLDPALCLEADIKEFERVEIYNCNAGTRFATYAIYGKEGDVCLNGAAARLVQPEDRIIIATYADYEDDEILRHTPRVLLLNERNEVKKGYK